MIVGTKPKGASNATISPRTVSSKEVEDVLKRATEQKTDILEKSRHRKTDWQLLIPIVVAILGLIGIVAAWFLQKRGIA